MIPRKSSCCCTILLTVFGILMAYQPRAHAYLDPGTGSLIVQAIIGVFLATALTAKLWWRRLMGLFFKYEDEDEEDGIE